MKNSGGIIIGILVAAAAGVVLGMLVTPEKGEDLRKSIKDTAGDWTKKIGNLLTDGKEELKSAKNSLADGANDLKRDVRTTKV
jgi:gas vesicle protein